MDLLRGLEWMNYEEKIKYEAWNLYADHALKSYLQVSTGSSCIPHWKDKPACLDNGYEMA